MPERADYDAIVVGAGFAGAIAARELATRGHRVLVLEARDMPGGRTCTATLSNGDLVEVGGTYVHWLQPHVWAEISRYDLKGDLVPGAEPPEAALAPAEAGLAWTDIRSYVQREERLLTAFFAGSAAIVPRPFHPDAAPDAIAAADGKTIADRLGEMKLSEPDQALIEAFFGVHTAAPMEESGYLTEVRWWAPSGHNFASMQDTVWTYKLASGMRTLIGGILADGAPEVRYRAFVSRVRVTAGRVTVTASTGESWTARGVVVATPAGVWPDIEFVPALAPDRVAAALEGLQASRGSKGYAVVRGESRAVTVQPRPGHPLGALWTSHRRAPDEQVMVFFGTRDLNDATDLAEVNAAVRSLLGDHVVVTEVAARNYGRDDPTLRGGWPVMKPGQYIRFRPHVRFLEPQGPVAFATADISTGWNGFIDGAIEAGLVAARHVRALLSR